MNVGHHREPAAPAPRCRILFVGHLPPVQGGAAIIAGQLLEALSQRGLEITALSFTTADHNGHRRFEDMIPSIPVTRYRETHRPFPDFITARADAVRALLPEMFAAVQPDFVIVGNESFAPAVVDLAKAHDLPCLVMVHGVLGLMGDAQTAKVLADLLVPSLQRSDAVVSVARHLTRRLQGLQFARIETIENGVDSRHFHPGLPDGRLKRELGATPDDLVVLHFSSLRAEKRPLDIVRAAEIVSRTTRAIRFVIVGDGPYRPAAEEASIEAGVADLFRFTGWLPHEDMPAYYRLADLVLMPSDLEAMALVFLETMASGRVLVASDIPAAREIVVPGETGMLFARRDPEALAATILHLADKPGLRAEIGTRARRTVETRYDLATKMTCYAALIDDLLSVRAG